VTKAKRFSHEEMLAEVRAVEEKGLGPTEKAYRETEVRTRSFEGVTPQWDYILVRRPEHGDRTKEGTSIIMPGAGRDKNEAEVLAVGPGILHDGKAVPMPFKVGDRVVLAVANYHEIRTETADVLLVKAGLVLATITPDIVLMSGRSKKNYAAQYEAHHVDED
jgi:chaperonin GroES